MGAFVAPPPRPGKNASRDPEALVLLAGCVEGCQRGAQQLDHPRFR
jgi:hypothetical protein